MTRAEKKYLIQHHRHLAEYDEEDAIAVRDPQHRAESIFTAKAHRAAIALLRRTKTKEMISHDVRGVLRAFVDRVPGAKTHLRRNAAVWLHELCNEADALTPSPEVIDAIRDACSSCEYNPCMSHSELQAAKARMRLVHEWLQRVEGLRAHAKASGGEHG